MSRPSIAQRRLEDLTAEHNILAAKLLSTIHDAISNTPKHEIKIKSKYGGIYTLNMEGIHRDDVLVGQWDDIMASQLLEIYSQIIENM